MLERYIQAYEKLNPPYDDEALLKARKTLAALDAKEGNNHIQFLNYDKNTRLRISNERFHSSMHLITLVTSEISFKTNKLLREAHCNRTMNMSFIVVLVFRTYSSMSETRSG